MTKHLVTCQFTKQVQPGHPPQIVVASTIVTGSLIEWFQSDCWRITFPNFTSCIILHVVTEEVDDAPLEVSP